VIVRSPVPVSVPPLRFRGPARVDEADGDREQLDIVSIVDAFVVTL